MYIYFKENKLKDKKNKNSVLNFNNTRLDIKLNKN
jgi:hypothetical protein